MGMLCAVAVLDERAAALRRPGVICVRRWATRCCCPPTTAPEVGTGACGRRNGPRGDGRIPGLLGMAGRGRSAAAGSCESARPSQGRGQATGPRARAPDEGRWPSTSCPTAATRTDDLLLGAEPGRLPLAVARPLRDAGQPGRAAAAVGAGRGAGAGRHRLVRAGPVLRDVPQGLRAGHGRMAKDQDLPLNPMRISGACGRLMCCLKYEHPLYQEFKAAAPAIGEEVDHAAGPGRVVGHCVPGDSVVVRLNDGGRRCSCSRASVCGSRQFVRGESVGAGAGRRSVARCRSCRLASSDDARAGPGRALGVH